MKHQKIFSSFLCGLFLCTLCVITSFAQTAKGFNVAKQEEKKTGGKIYALIIGISKYQNPAIPALEYATKDAMAFYDYLKAEGVDTNNIILLSNEKAKYTEILLDLDDICTNKAKADDKVYFYFSGHGDVESRVITNAAYLLPYDAPAKVYAISAIKVETIQEYFATLSAKKVQLIVITDACHSGNLAGGIDGLKNIQNVLKENWKDEIKILSCQPGELSLESKQWGGGRGLFSYELINGLAGQADKDNDGVVSLRELNLFMMEKVPEEAKPLPQNPMLTGNMAETISSVNKNYLAALGLINSTQTLSMIDTRGLDEALLHGLNDSIKINYHLFKTYLDSGGYAKYEMDKMTAKNDFHKLLPSAYYYYQKIPATEKTDLLIALMKRNLCGAIIDHGTVALNSVLNNKREIFTFEANDLVAEMKVLRQAIGDEKLKSLGFLSKAIFFEVNELEGQDYLKNETALLKIDSAISIDPLATYLYVEKAQLLNSLERYSESLEVSYYLEKLSPKVIFTYDNLGDVYFEIGQYDSSIYYYNYLVGLDSTFYLDMLLANGKSYLKKNLPDSAELCFTKILEYKPNDKYLIKNSLTNHMFHFHTISEVGLFYWHEKNFNNALKYFNYVMADSIFYHYYINYSNLNLFASMCYSSLNDTAGFLKYLDLALSKGEIKYPIIGKKFSNMSANKEYCALIKKYFKDDMEAQAFLYCAQVAEPKAPNADQYLKQNNISDKKLQFSFLSGVAAFLETKEKYSEALPYYEKANALDSTDVSVNGRLAAMYKLVSRDTAKATAYYLKAIRLGISNETQTKIYRGFTDMLIQEGKTEEAEKYLNEMKSLSFLIPENYYEISILYSKMNRSKEALDYFKLALEKGYRDYGRLRDDSNINVIRSSPEFIALLKKHFPDKYNKK